ncbi:MAG: GNAT family N-acetyltransferase [Arenibacterium sp.]
MSVNVRALVETDLEAALTLYTALSGTIPSPVGDRAREQFRTILAHSGTTVMGAEVDRDIRAIATLHVLPNMTNGAPPYALLENVVTAPGFERRALARAVIEAAISRAWAADAYKIMLLTGRETGAKGFYEKLGFTSEEKHAMTIRRLPPRAPVR